MSRILIFSDDHRLIESWLIALGSNYQTDIITDIFKDFNADAVIIDAKKINQRHLLFSVFEEKTTTRFLIIGNNWPESHQIDMLVHGAAGYCNQSESVRLLALAIQCILKGDIWIQRHLITKVIQQLVEMTSVTIKKEVNSHPAESLKSLSKRELDVAKMIKSGGNNKAIALTLKISERTVKAHLTSIFKKLNVPDRLHLALFIKGLD